MVAFLSKSDASAGFDQVVDFLNAQVIQYALMVNITIYVSCIKQFWATVSIKKANNVVKFVKRTAWNEFSYSMASAVICLATEEEDEVEVPNVPTPPSPTIEPSPPPQDLILTPPQAQHAIPLVSPQEEQPTTTSESDMTLLNTLIETCATLSQKGRIDDISVAATKDVSAAEPTVFDDEEVGMTMAQTLIKMKAKKARLLDEQMAKRLYDEEVEKAVAKEKQEKDDFEKAKGLQQQKCQSLKRKPVSIAQAKKNMIIYLKNMAGYKMEHFRGMTYDKKRVVEETLLQESFKKLKVVEVLGSESTQDTPTNDQNTSTNDPKEMSKEDVQNMLEIILVTEFKVEALQVKYPLIDWEIHSEGSRTYWKIIRVGRITEAY
nr:hypothetical protein [Tanacetum cinerariifolium]